MGCRWKHFKTIMKHKQIVYQECAACGIPWRGLVHDLSKFSPIEFASSARYFQGDKSPIEAEKIANGYSIAWLHHKGCNKHHWEWWCDFGENGEIIANKIPLKYVIEMICDWIGAGKVYSGLAWTQHSPLEYYRKVRAGRYFEERTENLIVNLLKVIDEEGLAYFHMVCRTLVKGNITECDIFNLEVAKWQVRKKIRRCMQK